jgi:transposase
MNSIRYVGLDVHKETIVVAVADLGVDPVSHGTIPNRAPAVAKLVERLQQEGRFSLVVAYEAGPTGFAIYRQLTTLGVACQVVAPGLIPQAPNDRVKTDRRDAAKLARLLRSGDLTPAFVPGEEHEALRNLVRSRSDAKAATTRCQHQLSKFLLRQGLNSPYPAWGLKWFTWLNQLRFSQAANQLVLDDYLQAVRGARERVKVLEAHIDAAVATSPLAPLVNGLQGFRGIQMVTAATIAVEAGDLTRFTTAKEFMSYTGLVPSEYSSGPSTRRGRISRCGNRLLRHVLVEAAHHSRHKPSRGAALIRRQTGLTAPMVELSWRAQCRLHRRFWALQPRLGNNKTVVAVARELAGFVWQAGQLQGSPTRLELVGIPQKVVSTNPIVKEAVVVECCQLEHGCKGRQSYRQPSLYTLRNQPAP